MNIKLIIIDNFHIYLQFITFLIMDKEKKNKSNL